MGFSPGQTSNVPRHDLRNFEVPLAMQKKLAMPRPEVAQERAAAWDNSSPGRVHYAGPKIFVDLGTRQTREMLIAGG